VSEKGSLRGASLAEVGLSELRALARAIWSERLRFPLNEGQLRAEGFGSCAGAVLGALAPLERGAAAAILDLLVADREQRPSPRVELVWTGPEREVAESRKTSVVVRRLFEEARTSVLVAGYAFDHGEEILRPLHRAMLEQGVRATFFLDIPGQAPTLAEVEVFARHEIRDFLEKNWPFGPPHPVFYYDPRTVSPELHASLHAKCVVVDDVRALVTSANFTSRGHERNIEVGVLIEDADFARRLAAHWHGLATRGLVSRYVP
jgi:phosphatidylserine/phosphatidylglycerophosphate/cardiolipin synthase-like enzyme